MFNKHSVKYFSLVNSYRSFVCLFANVLITKTAEQNFYHITAEHLVKGKPQQREKTLKEKSQSSSDA